MSFAAAMAAFDGMSDAELSPMLEVNNFDLFDHLADSEHEKVVICNQPEAGLRAIIAIHSTQLGPANGGVRMRPYESTEEALRDVLKLSRAMTYKWAAAGEDRGGGKAVIIGDPNRDKTEVLLRAFGRCVDELRGEYYVGEDLGMTLTDMETIHIETDFVATLPETAGGLGDIAPWTARGVVHAMRACAKRVWGTPDLAGRSVAVQGLGACGSLALAQLVEQGAKPIVTDVEPERVAAAVETYGVASVEPDAIYDVEADIFAPFALGGVINDDTIERLPVKVVAGSANNIFDGPTAAEKLQARGIVYAPDFIANAGGAIFDAEQFRKGGVNLERAAARIAAIEQRVETIFSLAEESGMTYQAAAYAFAERRMRELGALRRGPQADG